MTHRERQAPGSVSAVAPPPALGEGAGPAASRPRPASDHALVWEEFYRSVSPDQQRELLSLAGRQGLLYAHQLPTGNGHRLPSTDAPAGPQRLLAQILEGQTAGLDPVRATPVTIRDSALDATQREAVARALSTPDFCLIQGLPGTGKSRVVAEIVVQATARGQRVLLLAPSVAALDRVLETVSETVCAIYCPGKEERAEDLPSSIRGLVFAERARALRERSVLCARQGREQAEQSCRQRHQESGLWARLLEVSECWERVEAQRAELRALHDRLAEEVRQEATAEDSGTPARCGSAFVAALAAWRQNRNQASAATDAAMDTARGQHSERLETVKLLKDQVQALRRQVVARQQGRWWSPGRWIALLKGNVAAKLAAAESRLEEAQTALRNAEEEIQRRAAERSQAEQGAQTELQRLIEIETKARQDELASQEHPLAQEAALLHGKWDNLCQALERPCDRPEDCSVAAVHAAQGLWEANARQDEERCTFARQWSAYLEEAAEEIATRLPDYANLVAATTSALPADPHFGDAHAGRQAFDLLILEDATHVTESEFLQLARRAARWVLVGEPAIDGEGIALTAKAAPGKPPRPGHTVGPGLAALRAGFFQRLWQQLHVDPSRLPCAWVQEGERVCCRLRHVAPDQCRWVESERVADFPEIELRILTLPRLPPVLAEVVFPAAMSIHDAKQYLYRELQEIPVQTTGRSLIWREEPDRLILHLARSQASDARPVPLKRGVNEWVGRTRSEDIGPGQPATAWHTCRIEFERAAGWDRAGAETWIRHHLQMCDVGRTVFLETPQRMTPGLAAVVWDILFDERLAIEQDPVCAPAVEFVTVPPVKARRSRGEGRGTRGEGSVAPWTSTPRPSAGMPPPSPLVPRPSPLALPRSGAGLELDLAAPRQGDRLPSELRAGLPRQGFVNFFEAQAIVRRVEMMAAPGCADAASIAIIALYPAQVELIRRLLQQSAPVRKAAVPIVVDLPGTFQQRDCPVVLISLTRSPSRRAVAFGDSPRALTLALTRACKRLILFGDAGSCVSRSLWQGPLDHLDEGSAAREAQVFARLVRYLQGQGRQPHAFHLSEGSSA